MRSVRALLGSLLLSLGLAGTAAADTAIRFEIGRASCRERV